MIGKTVSHYKILEQIGEGGMGVVYKAHDSSLDRHVALKFLPQQLRADEKARKRFIREARAASALQHPNICSIHEIGDTPDGQTFIVMPCYEGQTLRERIEEEGPVPVAEALGIITQIASGLSKAHGRDIVHRDIKPANVFVTVDGHAVILDFGLAKLARQSRVTRTGTTVGTVAYMSPEQIGNDKVDQRSDIWSLGVVLFEMLTGRLPFRGKAEPAIMYSIVNEEPAPLPKTGSVDLSPVLRKMLEKDPDKRYQDIDSLMRDLKPLARETGIDVPAWSGPRAGGRRVTRIVSAVAIVAVVALAYYWQNRTPGEPTEPLRKSIAVMPFENLTGDPEFDVWTRGLPELITTELSNSAELHVLDRQTVQGALEEIGTQQAASISLPIAREISKRTDVETFVLGSIMKAGDEIRVQAKLQNVKNGDLLKAMVAEGESESDFFTMSDTLAAQIKDYLEIDVLKLLNPDYDRYASGTESAEAYRFFVQGMDARYEAESMKAFRLLIKAAEQDTNFMAAAVNLSFQCFLVGWWDGGVAYMEKLYPHRDELPVKYRYMLDAVKATFADKLPYNAIATLELLVDILPYDQEFRWWLSGMYMDVQEYEKAAANYEEMARIAEQRDEYKVPQPLFHYWGIGECFHHLGDYDRGIKLLDNPRDKSLSSTKATRDLYLAVFHYEKGDTAKAGYYERECRKRCDEGNLVPEMAAMFNAVYYLTTGRMERALEIYGDLLEEQPDFWFAKMGLARQMIDNDIDVDLGVTYAEEVLADHLEETKLGWAIAWARIMYFDVYNTLGWGYYKQGKYEEAVASLEIAWERIPMYEHTHKVRLDAAREALANQEN